MSFCIALSKESCGERGILSFGESHYHNFSTGKFGVSNAKQEFGNLLD